MCVYHKGNFKLSEDMYRNDIQINKEDFNLAYLNADMRGNKGASSNVFLLQDPLGEEPDRVIKICKSPYVSKGQDRRLLRFGREVRAFEEVQARGIAGIIGYFASGVTNLAGLKVKYIVLEKATMDLAEYLERNKFQFTLSQRVNFCFNLLSCLSNLHQARIYHRDIKPDNILIVDREMKIGDLGLVKFRDRDASMDFDNEKIGPAGWLSPEATNKMLTFKKTMGANYDCDINTNSDIFQLGKLFWYILQGNAPTGQVQRADAKFEDDDLFNIIFSMIQYDQRRRPSIEQILEAFDPIRRRLFI